MILCALARAASLERFASANQSARLGLSRPTIFKRLNSQTIRSQVHSPPKDGEASTSGTRAFSFSVPPHEFKGASMDYEQLPRAALVRMLQEHDEALADAGKNGIVMS